MKRRLDYNNQYPCEGSNCVTRGNIDRSAEAIRCTDLFLDLRISFDLHLLPRPQQRCDLNHGASGTDCVEAFKMSPGDCISIRHVAHINDCAHDVTHICAGIAERL